MFAPHSNRNGYFADFNYAIRWGPMATVAQGAGGQSDHLISSHLHMYVCMCVYRGGREVAGGRVL